MRAEEAAANKTLSHARQIPREHLRAGALRGGHTGYFPALPSVRRLILEGKDGVGCWPRGGQSPAMEAR